jgi:hypothetical protein
LEIRTEDQNTENKQKLQETELEKRETKLKFKKLANLWKPTIIYEQIFKKTR